MAKLPKNIVFYCRPNIDNYNVEGTDRWINGVYEAFPTAEDCTASTKENASAWCKHYNRYSKGLVFTFPNEPMYDVQIVGIDVRGQGAKIYKAIVHGKFYVDLYPQHLLDLMTHGTVENGIIKSPMVFVRCQGGLKLMRVDSKDYYEAIHDIKKPKRMNSEDLEAGKVYFTEDMSTYAFVVNNAYMSTRTNVKNVTKGLIFFNPNQASINFGNLEVIDVKHTYQRFTNISEDITGDIQAKYREIIEYYANYSEIDYYVERVELHNICHIVSILNTVDYNNVWPTLNDRFAKLYDVFMKERV